MATKEIHSGDIASKQKPDINLALDTDLTLVRQNENIIVDAHGVNDDYLKDLAFMEEKVTIRLERTNEKHASEMISLGVNGRTEWLKVGEVVSVARKYLEVLARCKSDIITTIAPSAGGSDVVNRLSRNSSQKHPFSIIADPNPRGAEWITGIMAQ